MGHRNHRPKGTGDSQRPQSKVAAAGPTNGSIITVQICGTVLWAGWVVLTLCSARFAWGVPALERPVLPVTLGLIALSLVHLYAVAMVRRSAREVTASASKSNGVISLPTIIGFALAMRFLAVFSTPIQELDYYRYMWDGETILAGANPFQVTPQAAVAASHEDQGFAINWLGCVYIDR